MNHPQLTFCSFGPGSGGNPVDSNLNESMSEEGWISELNRDTGNLFTVDRVKKYTWSFRLTADTPFYG